MGKSSKKICFCTHIPVFMPGYFSYLYPNECSFENGWVKFTHYPPLVYKRLLSWNKWIIISASNISSEEYQKLLNVDLMKNYNRIIRPVQNISDAISVTIEPVLYVIIEVVRTIHVLQGVWKVTGGFVFWITQPKLNWLGWNLVYTFSKS